jgi:hypothetical protein
MAHDRCRLFAAALICAVLTGCAAAETAPLQPAALAEAPPPPPPVAKSPVEKVSTKKTAQAGGTMQPDGTYMLGAEELKYDCKKLTGRVMVRILQMRNHEIRQGGSVVSRTAQQAVVPIFGGTTRGADPDADYRRDRALVEAYNKRLAEKKCKVFDLTKELQPKPAGESPLPKKG